MIQKVLRVGTSAAVTIPKKTLEQLGLAIGDQVNVEVNQRERMFMVRPEKTLRNSQTKIAKLTLDFVNRYRKDLETLAKE